MFNTYWRLSIFQTDIAPSRRQLNVKGNDKNCVIQPLIPFLVNTKDFRSADAVSLLKLPVNTDPRSVAKSDNKSSASSSIMAAIWNY